MATRTANPSRPHVIRVLIPWIILTVAGWIAVSFIHFPFDLSVQGQDQARTLLIMTYLATPVFMGVVVMLVYSGIVFRRRPGEQLVDGLPVTGNTRIQATWIVVSLILVLSLAVLGITTLISSQAAQAIGAAGRAIGGEGETGAAIKETGSELQVQVIAQQWYFTYRFPDYGGVETTHLELPAGVPVEFHVTSLDIIHSWWAYQLGVKADANPGVDNQFHMTPRTTGSFTVRCAELCGIWHGEMADTTGQVVSQGDFNTWIAQQQSYFAEIQKALPSYGPYYFPAPLTKGS
ncbi:MAG TPA: cytochrome c oxidase subunit II [Candidatus Limnocylindrales bacterium]|nr:cytochrome c oxidase subunit II [Candidatus Limnocylindrales bacterium]